MRKVMIIFIMSLFVAMPAHALKLIVNDSADRTVPSRSSTQTYEYVDESLDYNSVGTKNIADLKYLSDNIRGELVGTTWFYPEFAQSASGGEQTVQYIENSKNYTREAADYYEADTLNHPNKLVPVGYSQ